MCAQCTAAGVMGATTAAAGGRVWLAYATRRCSGFSGRAATAVLIVLGVLLAGVLA